MQSEKSVRGGGLARNVVSARVLEPSLAITHAAIVLFLSPHLCVFGNAIIEHHTMSHHVTLDPCKRCCPFHWKTQVLAQEVANVFPFMSLDSLLQVQSPVSTRHGFHEATSCAQVTAMPQSSEAQAALDWPCRDRALPARRTAMSTYDLSMQRHAGFSTLSRTRALAKPL